MTDQERDEILLRINEKVDRLVESAGKAERAEKVWLKGQESEAREALKRLTQQGEEPQTKSAWQGLRQRLGL